MTSQVTGVPHEPGTLPVFGGQAPRHSALPRSHVRGSWARRAGQRLLPALGRLQSELCLRSICRGCKVHRCCLLPLALAPDYALPGQELSPGRGAAGAQGAAQVRTLLRPVSSESLMASRRGWGVTEYLPGKGDGEGSSQDRS